MIHQEVQQEVRTSSPQPIHQRSVGKSGRRTATRKQRLKSMPLYPNSDQNHHIKHNNIASPKTLKEKYFVKEPSSMKVTCLV